MLDGRRSRYDHGEYSYRYWFNLDDDGFNRDDPRNRSAYLYVKSPRRFPTENSSEENPLFVTGTKTCGARRRHNLAIHRLKIPRRRGSERHRLISPIEMGDATSRLSGKRARVDIVEGLQCP